MYIPEFWCGVIATIFIEIAAIIGYGIVSAVTSKDKKNRR